MAGVGFDQALVGATAAMAHGQAALLGADSGLRAMMTAWVPGRPVCPQMTGHAPDADACTRIGAALAALHADPFRPAAAWTAPADARSVLTAAADLAPLDADLSVLAHGIATDLTDRLAQALAADGPVVIDVMIDADQLAPVVAELLKVDNDAWRGEIPLIEEHFSFIGERLPNEMADELRELEKRLAN